MARVTCSYCEGAGAFRDDSGTFKCIVCEGAGIVDNAAGAEIPTPDEEATPNKCWVMYTEGGTIKIRGFEGDTARALWVGNFTLKYIDNRIDNVIEAFFTGTLEGHEPSIEVER